MAVDKYRVIESMLYKYTPLKNEIKNIELEIEELRNDYHGCGAISYDEKSSPTYKFSSSVENEIESKNKKITYLEKLKRSKEIQVEKINNALEVLDQQQRKIIELRYLNPKKIGWFHIADILGVSDVTCRNIKLKAINAIIPVVFVSNISEKLT